MKVGDLVRYIPYGHDEPLEDIGIFVKFDDGCFEVHFADGETMTDLIFSELEVV